MDDGPYKQVTDAYSCKMTFTDIAEASFSGNGIRSTLDVLWMDGKIVQFPCTWLRLYAPMVAKCEQTATTEDDQPARPGWDVASLAMPEISYADLFPTLSDATRLRIYELLAHEGFPGILKVTGLPAPDVASEREGVNTLLATVLKQIFGSVFAHPRRSAERTYNIASHHVGDVRKGHLVPNYNTANYLLPYVDQSFCQHHTRIVGLYILEGDSDNAFASGPGVLATLKDEHPELVAPLRDAPVAFGRAGKMYAPTQYQGATATAVTPRPRFPDQIDRFRWHPHLVGALLCPFDAFPLALEAHRTFQAIMDRPSHRLRLRLAPSDMYLFDNHRVFHGRERVAAAGPRTCVGQSAPEQAVLDGWREALIARLPGFMEEKWLIHVPLMQPYELDKMVNCQ